MWFPMKKGQQNGGILPEKREGYLKAVEFIIHRLMNFPDNQTRKMGGTNGCRNALSAGAAERSAVFRGTRACMPEAAQPQVASPPEKPRGVREVWRSQTCARSRLSFASFSLAKQRKRGLRRRMSFCGVKTKPSLEGFVLTKLKQDLCKRACFCVAKRVPAPA